jgi:hypothetical protein
MHEHEFQGQKLVHDHAGGDQQHGYFEHPEDVWKPGRSAARRQVRAHSSDDMNGVGELNGVMAPVAVVLRSDGSVDAYGDLAVIDQRKDEETDESLTLRLNTTLVSDQDVIAALLHFAADQVRSGNTDAKLYDAAGNEVGWFSIGPNS